MYKNSRMGAITKTFCQAYSRLCPTCETRIEAACRAFAKNPSRGAKTNKNYQPSLNPSPHQNENPGLVPARRPRRAGRYRRSPKARSPTLGDIPEFDVVAQFRSPGFVEPSQVRQRLDLLDQEPGIQLQYLPRIEFPYLKNPPPDSTIRNPLHVAIEEFYNSQPITENPLLDPRNPHRETPENNQPDLPQHQQGSTYQPQSGPANHTQLHGSNHAHPSPSNRSPPGPSHPPLPGAYSRYQQGPPIQTQLDGSHHVHPSPSNGPQPGPPNPSPPGSPSRFIPGPSHPWQPGKRFCWPVNTTEPPGYYGPPWGSQPGPSERPETYVDLMLPYFEDRDDLINHFTPDHPLPDFEWVENDEQPFDFNKDVDWLEEEWDAVFGKTTTPPIDPEIQ